MDAIPTNPQTLPSRHETFPVHHFHVVFWRQAIAREEFPQSAMVWSSAEHEVVDVGDVHELLAWADEEARTRRAAYTVCAITEYYVPVNEIIGEAATEFDRREMAVWLGAWNPVQSTGPNFGRMLPPDAQPVWGIPEDLYPIGNR